VLLIVFDCTTHVAETVESAPHREKKYLMDMSDVGKSLMSWPVYLQATENKIGIKAPHYLVHKFAEAFFLLLIEAVSTALCKLGFIILQSG
jgi:hypothetical protein